MGRMLNELKNARFRSQICRPRLNGPAEAYLLGLWIGDGCIHKNGSFFCVSEDAERAFRIAYFEWSGEEPKIYQYNPKVLVCWSGVWGVRLRELGYDWPCPAKDKEIKPLVLSFEVDLLDGLWQSDGTLYLGPKGVRQRSGVNFRYGYCRSEKLCLQIIELLARMGVEARMSKTTINSNPAWAVNVMRKYHAFLAARMILEGEKGRRLRLAGEKRIV